ncbi:carboxypeptidase regulatory-like domain-containing protein [Candidatus Kaiserbacteria bacterium]|nr:carboxypeptidase regulatory-like domain-containing protein [Candidatus Kaiserbacteria bacterium]
MKLKFGHKQNINRSIIYGSKQAGFSFVELIVTAAMVALVFGGLYAGVSSMIKVIANSKAKAGATALMVGRMEYIRSLPYSQVGTVSGVPPGLIPQNSTTSINGIIYNERILIEYVDDEADGYGGADVNAILADYKRVKVEYSWQNKGVTKTVSLVSNIVPVGIETTDGGGTIKVNVFNALTQPVSGAEVRFINTSSSTMPIDTTRFTGVDGLAYLSGAPAMANYEIYVTKTGYSSDSTYIATSTNPNPSTPPVSVIESAVSTMNFQIDLLSNLNIKTQSNPTYASFEDNFLNDTLLATSSNTVVSGGSLVLADSGGIYQSSGFAISTTTTPSPIEGWYSVDFAANIQSSTSVLMSLYYDNSGVLTLVPDTDLPGNSVGFSTSPIDIQSLDTSTYDNLSLGATLSTIDTAYTPSIDDWSITHIVSQPNLSGVPITVIGNKTIGTYVDLTPVYKYLKSDSTDGSGELNLTDIEYDLYSFEIDPSTYSIIEICDMTPVSLVPNDTVNVDITLGSPTASQLLVRVVDPSQSPIANATVRLERSGVDVTQTTSLCGQTYFTGGLPVADDYQVTVSAPGYITEVLGTTTVNSSSVLDVNLGS